MTIAKVINIGAEQLIDLPAEFHVEVEQVEINSKNGHLIIDATTNDTNNDMTESTTDVVNAGHSTPSNDFYQKLMEWRAENADILDDEDPWADVRSKEMGREFSWEDD